MQKSAHTVWGLGLMLLVFTLTSMSANASLMPLRMLSHHMPTAHHMLNKTQLAHLHAPQVMPDKNCCNSDTVLSDGAACVVTCAVFSAVLLPRAEAQAQPLEHIALITKDIRVQARSMLSAVYRPPIV